MFRFHAPLLPDQEILKQGCPALSQHLSGRRTGDRQAAYRSQYSHTRPKGATRPVKVVGPDIHIHVHRLSHAEYTQIPLYTSTTTITQAHWCMDMLVYLCKNTQALILYRHHTHIIKRSMHTETGTCKHKCIHAYMMASSSSHHNTRAGMGHTHPHRKLSHSSACSPQRPSQHSLVFYARYQPQGTQELSFQPTKGVCLLNFIILLSAFVVKSYPECPGATTLVGATERGAASDMPRRGDLGGCWLCCGRDPHFKFFSRTRHSCLDPDSLPASVMVCRDSAWHTVGL